MAGILRVAAVALAVSLGSRAPAVASGSPTLAIRVIDYAHAASGALIEAQHHVTRLFGVAGVTVAWREGDASLPATATDHVTVVILSDAMAAEKIAAEHLSSLVLATAAPPPAHRAWIFLRRVNEAAERQQRSPGLALGHVIAHEIAHMVASVGHSQSGVMASSVQFTDSLQGFTREQGERIRAAVQLDGDARTLDARNRSRAFLLNRPPSR
jgi:hypothetical protein